MKERIGKRGYLEAALRNLAVASGLKDEITARRLAKLSLVYVQRGYGVGAPSLR